MIEGDFAGQLRCARNDVARIDLQIRKKDTLLKSHLTGEVAEIGSGVHVLRHDLDRILVFVCSGLKP